MTQITPIYPVANRPPDKLGRGIDEEGSDQNDDDGMYEIVEQRYHGRLEIGNNPLGGALVKMLNLPAVLAGRCVLNASSRRAVRT